MTPLPKLLVVNKQFTFLVSVRYGTENKHVLDFF
ncbi:uncharacterized protein METZ01_LOCUS488399, partial [marine metagenome]